MVCLLKDERQASMVIMHGTNWRGDAGDLPAGKFTELLLDDHSRASGD